MRHDPPTVIDGTRIHAVLSAFGVSPSEDQIAQIREYLRLLSRWNQTISLTALTDPEEIVGRHFGESLYGSKLLPVENCRLADVGTGAGFPGLALKIFYPTIELVLIDSNKKKCAFLAEIVRTLALSNVDILAERFEQIRPEKIAANVITSRAVGEFKPLLKWSRKGLIQRGHVMLWIGAEDSVRVSGIEGWSWQPASRIPDSQRRFVLIGRPVDQQV
jgi:16S rRNA (guanine527-N7)-methyltransferase